LVADVTVKLKVSWFAPTLSVNTPPVLSWRIALIVAESVEEAGE
jgi:hypothetical protein